jgi:hypothetical protein
MPKKPQTATDGISRNPEHAITTVTVYTDWEQLRRAFMIQETHTMIGTWLQQVMGWDIKRIRSGHTRRMVNGWGKDRAKLQAKKTQIAIEKALEIERQNIPTLRAAKAQLIANIVKDVGRWDRLNMMDKKLCYEILKVELREPTNVKDLPPPDARDPVEALLEEYGLMKDGVIIDDSPEEDSRLISRADSPETTEADSSTSVEVSQA